MQKDIKETHICESYIWLGWRDKAQASCASPWPVLTYDEPDLSKAQGVRIPPERYKKDSHLVSHFYMAGHPRRS